MLQGSMKGNTRELMALILNIKLNYESSMFMYTSISCCKGDYELPQKEFPKAIDAHKNTTKIYSCPFWSLINLTLRSCKSIPFLLTSSSSKLTSSSLLWYANSLKLCCSFWADAYLLLIIDWLRCFQDGKQIRLIILCHHKSSISFIDLIYQLFAQII